MGWGWQGVPPNGSLNAAYTNYIIPGNRIPEKRMDTVKLGRNGQLSLPRAVMKRLHLQGNETLILDVSDDGVIQLRPAAVLPVEMYTPERIAEFESESEVDQDTRAAVRNALAAAPR
jgi:AbrB family looped-hinge helix DNA binding protein